MRLRLRARAELLVDGDQTGIDAIREAIDHLREGGCSVQTTVYASPGRNSNKRWRDFFSEAGMSFKAIPRSTTGEVSDAAIVQRLRCLARSTEDVWLALMTADTDFVDEVRSILAQGRHMVVFVGHGAVSSVQKYESTGARVLQLCAGQAKGTGPKVRAILHAHGGGNVEMAEPWDSSDGDSAEVNELIQLLHLLGYRGERGYLVQSIAKFWFMHRLRALTVFPELCACLQLQRLLQGASAEAPWMPYRNKLAFFLPVAQAPRKTQRKINEYGGMSARRIYKGGGPFVIQDSEDMVAQALSMMGYLDYKCNDDLAEAMLTFVNMPENKLALRKYCDALPSPDDTVSVVAAKLRQAFLSHGTSGRWRLAPKDTQVRKELCKRGFLADVSSPQTSVLQAMARFARDRNLPEMRTYNGNLLRILHYINRSDPSRVGTVEFKT